MSDILIRQAVENDIPIIESIMFDVIDFLDSIGQPQWEKQNVTWQGLSRYFKADDFYIASIGDNAVGCMALVDHDPTFWPNIAKGTSLFIHKLAIKRCGSKKGVSKSLIDFAKMQAVKLGINEVRLDTHQFRDKVRAIYEHEGFMCVGERCLFERYHTAFYLWKAKYNIIHIVGASGAGTTTLGRAFEKEYGYKWLDTDDYFWMQTDPPFIKSLPREDRIKRLSESIEEYPKCVISGSLCGWGDVFIPKFDLVIFVDTPTDIRIERLEKREIERFDERIHKGGDMYENHVDFIEWAKTYDTSNPPERCRKLHEEWFGLLTCPLMRVDGTKLIDELINEFKGRGYFYEKRYIFGELSAFKMRIAKKYNSTS